MQLHWLYAWASVLLPIFGMMLSMFAHRYAYMNLASTIAVVFAYVAYRLYVDSNVDSKVNNIKET